MQSLCTLRHHCRLATQHSLPSGRYSLLGPDFHRLDRTSLRLAHSFDHLVCERKHHWRNFKAESLGSLKIDDKFEFYGLHDWQVGGLCAMENFASVDATLPS